MDETVQATDLHKLRDEILCKPAEAALPSQMSDYWLKLIARDLEALCEEPLIGSLAGPIALVLHLLYDPTATNKLEISIEEMHSYLLKYRLEVALEMVSRNTDQKVQPATLENIFKRRTV